MLMFCKNCGYVGYAICKNCHKTERFCHCGHWEPVCPRCGKEVDPTPIEI